MMLYGYIALKQFPKHERHVLGAEIRRSMLQLQRLIVTALKRYHKKTTLSEIDIEIAVLQRQVRFAKEMHYIDQRKYQNWSLFLVEMGKMIGGWLKAVYSKESTQKIKK